MTFVSQNALPRQLYHTMEPADNITFTWDGKLKILSRKQDLKDSEFYNDLFHHVRFRSIEDFQSAYTSCTKSIEWAIYSAVKLYHTHRRNSIVFELSMDMLESGKTIVREGKSIFNISSKEAQANYFTENQLRSVESKLAIESKEFVLKMPFEFQWNVAKYYIFGDWKSNNDSPLIQKLLQTANHTNSFQEWKENFYLLYSDIEDLEKLLNVSRISERKFCEILKNEYNIKPNVVPSNPEPSATYEHSFIVSYWC